MRKSAATLCTGCVSPKPNTHLPLGKNCQKQLAEGKSLWAKMQTRRVQFNTEKRTAGYLHEILAIGVVELQVARNEQRDHSECAGNKSMRM